MPIEGSPEITTTLSVCRLCLSPIERLAFTERTDQPLSLGAWYALTYGGLPIRGGSLCLTTTGEVTGHLPEPPLTWAERWDATVHFS